MLSDSFLMVSLFFPSVLLLLIFRFHPVPRTPRSTKLDFPSLFFVQPFFPLLCYIWLSQTKWKSKCCTNTRGKGGFRWGGGWGRKCTLITPWQWEWKTLFTFPLPCPGHFHNFFLGCALLLFALPSFVLHSAFHSRAPPPSLRMIIEMASAPGVWDGEKGGSQVKHNTPVPHGE